jgi:hypothetical protein
MNGACRDRKMLEKVRKSEMVVQVRLGRHDYGVYHDSYSYYGVVDAAIGKHVAISRKLSAAAELQQPYRKSLGNASYNRGCLTGAATEICLNTYYAPERDAGLVWGRPGLGIDWRMAARAASSPRSTGSFHGWLTSKSPFV